MGCAAVVVDAVHGEPVLELDSVGVALGAASILQSVSLHVAAGECLGIVGASGSGKSMTALAILQLLPAGAATRGAIVFRGRRLNGATDAELRALRGRDIGMIFQEPMTALNPLMRIGVQVAETVQLHRAVTRAEARSIALETLQAVGLSGVRGVFDRYPHELSGGQRQRAAIAIAIALKPALLIADEPTTALDVTTQTQILNLLRALVRDNRMSLLLISHDMTVLAEVSDRLAVMREGRILECVATSRFTDLLTHPYSRALLAAAELEPLRAERNFEAAAVVLEAVDVVRDYATLEGHGWWRRAVRRRAVDAVSLQVHAGETVGLVGESGSGKSTLLRALLALEPLQGGSVCVLNQPFSGVREAARRRLRRSLQAVFQDPYGSFDPSWRVGRLVAEPFALLDAALTPGEIESRVAHALQQVGLAPADAERFPHEFSGGQRQRIAIARALVTHPAVIVFDEAVSALDVVVRAQVLALLAGLSERLGLAYLFVSHDLHVVRAIADRVYVMQDGRVLEHGVTARVFADPQHAYTRNLMAAHAAGARLNATGTPPGR